MAGRRSVWSDPRILSLAQKFVLAADEVWRLQTGKDTECRWFQAMVAQSRPGGSRQGIYVATGGGRLLASINSLNADKVLQTIEKGYEKWKALSEEERLKVIPFDGHGSTDRWEDSYPSGGLVLETIKRDLPASGDATAEPARRWNRDFVWFSKEEVRSLVPRDPQVGQRYQFPRPLALRLARFHLVDNVRGQTLPFAVQEVSEATFEVRVESVKHGMALLSIEGRTRCWADAWLLGDNYWKPARTWPHGVEVRVLGEMRFDLASGTCTHFESVGVGLRWGRTVNNGRHGQPEPSPFGIVLRMVPEIGAHHIAPTFINLYSASWLRDISR